MLKQREVILLGFVVSLANFWIWKVIKGDLFLGAILILLSLMFVYLTEIKFNKKKILFFLLFLLIVSYQIIISGFDPGLKTVAPEQEKQLGERHGYFAINLGNFFQNKYVLRFYKDVNPYLSTYQSNVFNSLSLNLYFFSNHPRERQKVGEFPMYPAVFIAPFLVGLVYFLSRSCYMVTGYLIFALLITGLIRQNYIFGPVLLFPLINLLITIGCLKTFKVVKNAF